MVKLSLRQKSVLDLGNRVLLLKSTIKQWFFHAGMKFLQGRELTEEQEAFLAEFTDFITDSIDRIEQDKSFLKKATLGPIQLPKKKNTETVVKP